MKIAITENDALAVVDMQRDFMPGGALAVPGADRIVDRVNDYIRIFEKRGRPVYFTGDWHPEKHISFKANGGIWPVHCLQGSPGADFCDGLYVPSDNRFIISKGVSEDFDAYSAFQGTALRKLLAERGVKRLYVCGIATDYCVKETLLGAENLGLRTVLLSDAVKGVNTVKGDSESAVSKMLGAGAVAAVFDDLGYSFR
ncbi:nicotinamidase [Hydrogenimonas sp.]|nr:nicotinamidase [Hydrogenimonas sp.]